VTATEEAAATVRVAAATLGEGGGERGGGEGRGGEGGGEVKPTPVSTLPRRMAAAVTFMPRRTVSNESTACLAR